MGCQHIYILKLFHLLWRMRLIWISRLFTVDPLPQYLYIHKTHSRHFKINLYKLAHVWKSVRFYKRRTGILFSFYITKFIAHKYFAIFLNLLWKVCLLFLRAIQLFILTGKSLLLRRRGDNFLFKLIYSTFHGEIWNQIMQLLYSGARGSVVGWGTMLRAGRSPVRVSDEVDFFNLPNPSSRTMTLGSTQPLTELSTRNFPGSNKRPTRGADNLAVIYKPNVWKCGSLNLS
jgi:hypothetical protein